MNQNLLGSLKLDLLIILLVVHPPICLLVTLPPVSSFFSPKSLSYDSLSLTFSSKLMLVPSFSYYRQFSFGLSSDLLLRDNLYLQDLRRTSVSSTSLFIFINLSFLPAILPARAHLALLLVEFNPLLLRFLQA